MEYIYNKINKSNAILNRIKSMHFLYCDYSRRINEYKKTFNEDFGNFIEKNGVEIPLVEEKTEEKISEVVIEPADKPSKDIKQLYKKLTLKLHPDKNKSASDNEVFTIVDKLYKNNDLSGLILIAVKYKIIKQEDVLTFDEKEIDKGLHIYTEKINNIINSHAYRYYISDDLQKMDIINTIVESYRINVQDNYEEEETDELKFSESEDERDDIQDIMSKYLEPEPEVQLEVQPEVEVVPEVSSEIDFDDSIDFVVEKPIKRDEPVETPVEVPVEVPVEAPVEVVKKGKGRGKGKGKSKP